MCDIREMIHGRDMEYGKELEGVSIKSVIGSRW